jgi:ABC-type nitrate/sulfonate/bicarbonate transport system substrate-binding protein
MIAATALISSLATTSHAQGPTLKPEKTTLEVAIAATGPLYLPLLLAADAGYFDKRGLKVNLTVLSATVSAQALLSGQVALTTGERAEK